MFLRSPQGGDIDDGKSANEEEKKSIYIYTKVRGGLPQNQNEKKKKKVDHRREEEQRERTAISG